MLPSFTRTDSGIVLLDDTGSPGQRAGSTYLDPNRKTWVAVIATREQADTIDREMPRLLSEFTRVTGLREIHCAELFSGKGCREVLVPIRLAVLGALAEIFRQSGFRVLVQTVADYTVADFERHGAVLPTRVEEFNLAEPSWLAFFLLLARTKRFFKQHHSEFAAGCYFVADEGLRKAGTTLKTRMLADVAPDGRVHFAVSSKYAPLQLADFAAFAFNRHQWVMTKPKLSAADQEFLSCLEPMKAVFQNATVVEANPACWSPRDYERLIDLDREAKGLPSLQVTEREREKK